MSLTQHSLFDFDTWIHQNQLTPLQNALIALEFNNLTSLLSLSRPLIAFIISSHTSLQSLNTDKKNKLELLLIDALKQLKQHQNHQEPQELFHKNGVKNGKEQKSQDTFVIITKEENKVLQSLKNKLKTVAKYEFELNDLQKQYEIHKIEATDLYRKEMENICNIINETFEALHSALDKQHKLLLNKTDIIKQTELNNNIGFLSNFEQEIKECVAALDDERELITNSINKYQNIMRNSTQSCVQLLEFDQDLTNRSNLISSMGASVDKKFVFATNKLDDIMRSMTNKFKKEFEFLGHWTFVISDVMRDLQSNKYEIGIIDKITSTNIVDVDWIDNGSLVLYLSQTPFVYNNNEENEKKNEINNLQLKQYKIRYKYIDNDNDNKQESETETDDIRDDESYDDEDKLLLSEMDKREEDIFNDLIKKENEWTEISFNNLENEFLSTIPLKIRPFCLNNTNIRRQYQFVYIAQFICIQIQISCQFKLIRNNMSFWTKYCPIYIVTQNNIVLNDNLRIEENSNQNIIDNDEKYNGNNHENENENVSDNEIVEDMEEIEEEDLIFSSGMVRAWRFDEEQDKWRGRGKGNLFLYKNTQFNSLRIIFKDVKHENKIRLLQKIDYLYEHCGANVLNEVEWHGNDYSMDPHQPLNSLWKIKFIDQPQKIDKFIMIFNNAVDDAIQT